MNWPLLSELVYDKLTIESDVNRINRFGHAIIEADYYDTGSIVHSDLNEKQLVRNFIVNLDKKQSITLSKKIDMLKKFLNLISGGKQLSIIDWCIKEAGYTDNLPEIEIPKLKIPNAHLKKFDSRSYNPEIVTHSRKLYENKHYTNAVLEAAKAYNARVKKESGILKDGADLMMASFSENGTIKINMFQTDSEKNEQKGIMYLSAGLVQAFRNPAAHETAITWKITEEDCLDILSFISFLFNKLDYSFIYS